ncbi:hypothetical protein H8E65_10225 [Candidatus Bathyarchaeota archaeon]|nr:hypothetical protein [Candidatus Bathyarchaeota archaeon]
MPGFNYHPFHPLDRPPRLEQLVEELLLRGISVVEGIMLEINGANGVLRIDPLPLEQIANPSK